MNPPESMANGKAPYLAAELRYLEQVIGTRLKLHLGQDTPYQSVEEVPFPDLGGAPGPYRAVFQAFDLDFSEQLILLLALVPHVKPDFFDSVIAAALPQGGDFPQLGGTRGQQFRGFLPTGETALFLLADGDLDRRFAVQNLFAEDQQFAHNQILRVDTPPPGEPAMAGRLTLSQEFVEILTLGRKTPPRLSMQFPAQRLTTDMTWDELILPEPTMRQLRELQTWLEHGDTLLDDWGMGRKLKRGYRALFHGPPGTGKTLTASLLGRYTNREVYRVDLSMVVSKFIGETEKNLAQLFDKADNTDWILFFDEADALFGKRTSVRDAHDKYANQEVAYLLQRVETYGGLVILASNFKNNIDDAFMRRFQASIHFPLPDVSQRLRLWEGAFPEAVTLDEDVRLDQLARRYELTGAHVMNAVQYACLRALERGDTRIEATDLLTAIRREISKDGKVV